MSDQRSPRRRLGPVATAVVVIVAVVAVAAAAHRHTSTSATSVTAVAAEPPVTSGSSSKAAEMASSSSVGNTAVASSPTQVAGATSVSTTVAVSATATSPGLLVVSGDEGTVLDQGALSGPCHLHYAADGQALPDPVCTPGVVAARVTQAYIDSTICVSGYTTSVRPPSSVTSPLKRLTAEIYAMAYQPRVQEYDHLVPLELGGANDVRNLWVEPPTSPNQTSVNNAKDQVENELRALVCAGRVPLAVAQRRIATDWTTALAGL
jgi:hypothetical protein